MQHLSQLEGFKGDIWSAAVQAGPSVFPTASRALPVRLSLLGGQRVFTLHTKSPQAASVRESVRRISASPSLPSVVLEGPGHLIAARPSERLEGMVEGGTTEGGSVSKEVAS